MIELTNEVLVGSTDVFDRWAVLSLRDAQDLANPIDPTWMEEAGRDVTSIDGIAVMLIAIASATEFLAANRAFHTMIVLLVSTLSGMGASLLLKSLFAKPQLEFVPHFSHVVTSNFPSGHSMMAAVFYLTLAALIAFVLRQFWLRVNSIAVAVGITVPERNVRFVNVVDLMKLLMKLQPQSERPHALNDEDFDALFTLEKLIIFAFHSHPSLVHQRTYRRTNHDNLHERDHGLDMPEIRSCKWEPPNE